MTDKRQTGFSLLETMVALGVLSVVGAIVMTGMVQMMKTQSTIANRTEMHTSVRSATELLQQEIGQAGRLTLGSPNGGVTLANAVSSTSQAFTLNYPAGSPAPTLYQNEVLTVDTGGTDAFGNSLEEVVILSAGAANTGSAPFVSPHAQNAPVTALGAFATGVVPPDGTTTGSDPNGQCAPSSVTVGGTPVNYVAYTNGSTCESLKLYGDINGDGNIVIVRYDCVQGTQALPGSLYRQQLSYQDAVVNGKTFTEPPPPSAVLLGNVLSNPNDANGNAVPCFRYQVQPLGTGWVVTDVAVTLTVQTQNNDPVTHQPQKETKALLNVSPRNIFEVWTTASQNLADPTRAQAMPAWIAALL
jgi:prepilin-type N-terminal cleavage/methylation domain-containing protein